MWYTYRQQFHSLPIISIIRKISFKKQIFIVHKKRILLQKQGISIQFKSLELLWALTRMISSTKLISELLVFGLTEEHKNGLKKELKPSI